MMQLIIVVLSIALAALLAVGGIGYLDLGKVSKIISTSDFRAGKDALLLAVSSYKMTHNGALPNKATFDTDVSKYMPRGEIRIRMPAGAEDFHWIAATLPDGRAAICLENQTKASGPLNPGVVDSVISFAKREAVRSSSGDVHLTNACNDASSETEPAKMDRSVLPNDQSVAVSFALE